jgi:oxygen-dependent protoporphyrinogen oxidase
VLGGGLAGLTTAWYLTKFLPKSKIDIYEAGQRLGGWIETDKAEIKTPDGTVATVHFEHAARMVKPQTQAAPLPRWDDAIFFHMVGLLCHLWPRGAGGCC